MEKYVRAPQVQVLVRIVGIKIMASLQHETRSLLPCGICFGGVSLGQHHVGRTVATAVIIGHIRFPLRASFSSLLKARVLFWCIAWLFLSCTSLGVRCGTAWDGVFLEVVHQTVQVMCCFNAVLPLLYGSHGKKAWKTVGDVRRQVFMQNRETATSVWSFRCGQQPVSVCLLLLPMLAQFAFSCCLRRCTAPHWFPLAVFFFLSLPVNFRSPHNINPNTFSFNRTSSLRQKTRR